MNVAVARATGARSGDWLAAPGLGVYVHIPFCVHRCHYCDFNTYEGMGETRGPYVDAAQREIEMWPADLGPVTSIFFGGGTPTILEPGQLGSILQAIAGRLPLAADAEITIEANPETVDVRKFAALRAHGFNRVSIGVQSLVDRVLVGLGRTHSADTARTAVGAARSGGFDDVNVDVIYGSPWETADDWSATLSGVVDLQPDHVSAYALTVEDATPLATLVRTGRVPNVDPDVQADRYELACEVLLAAGMSRYEISNWARPGRASRHNVLYWSAGDYLGIGAGAHGHIGGRRSWNVKLPRDYVARVRQGRRPEAGNEELQPAERAAEALMLGLRLQTGVPLDAFSRRFGDDVVQERWPVIEDLMTQGLLELDAGNLALTERATFVANEVAARLL